MTKKYDLYKIREARNEFEASLESKVYLLEPLQNCWVLQK